MSFSVNITGFRTKEDIEQFTSWFSESGEQDFAIWLGCRKDEGIDVSDFISWKSERINETSIDMEVKCYCREN